MNYNDLYKQIKRKKSFLCVGLDTDPDLIPEQLFKKKYPLFEFNKAIIDATAEYTVAYKPNTAFYEAEGSCGWEQLSMTVSYLRKNYPEIFIIADAKRGDIGNTAKYYAKAFFEKMDFDAITISPYMGRDCAEPFLKYKDKWVIILALTSNASAEEFETCSVSEPEYEYLYRKVISKAITWGNKDNIMFVAGATRAEKLAEIRKICPDNFLLVPGVGAQGGTIEEVARYGLNDHCGLIVNSSRGIIFAERSERFAEAARNEAEILAKKMSSFII